MESEVLRRFYSDIQHAITNPIGVASLLHQEDVVGEVLLDEVSPTNKVSPVEKTASIMRHVEAAIRVDPKSFWVFLSVLDQFTPSYKVARRMKQAVALHASAAERKGTSTLPSSQSSKDDLFVSEVYQEDFDAISRKFISLHHRIADMLEENHSVSLEKLKQLLSTYADLKGPLESAHSFNSVMCVILEHSSIINCSSLRLIAEHFNLPEVTRELDKYKEQVDEFCQKTIREHSYVKQFVGKQPKHFLTTQTITLKLEWNPDKKTLADIQSLIRKTFHGLSDLIHVDVISEGSVRVVCYAPHYIMGALVQMAEENKNMLLEKSVSYLSIGYAVVLDRTSQEKEVLSLEEEVRDLKERNTSMLLSLTPLRERCVDLQSDNEKLKSSNSHAIHTLQYTTEENISLKESVSALQKQNQELLLSGKDKILDMKQEITTLQLLLTAQQGQPQLSESGKLSTCMSTQLPSEPQAEMTSTPLEKGLLRDTEVTLGGVTPDSFRYMMEHQGVKRIELIRGDATTEQVEAIFHGLRNNATLHELHVPNTRPPVDMSILSASLTVNNTLQDLTLGNDLDDHAMEQLSAGLQANGSVTKLTLWCHITDTGVQHLAMMLVANRIIEELRLLSSHFTRSDRISDHAMEQLSAGLRANRSLTRLTLHCRITDIGVQHLATMLAVNATLQKLDLSYAPITDHGVSHLSRALQHNSSVTHLNLFYCSSITNMGAVALGEMLKVNKSLRVLNLYGTSVKEEGATALMESLQHNQVLNELNISWELQRYCIEHKLYDNVKRANLIFKKP